MPTFTVHGADRKTGKERSLPIDAPDEQQAMSLAIDKGLMVIRAERQGPQPEAPLSTPPAGQEVLIAELRALRADVSAIRSASILRAPFGTIAGSIIVAMILWLIIMLVTVYLLIPAVVHSLDRMSGH